MSKSPNSIHCECIDSIDFLVAKNEPSREAEINLEALENMVAQGKGEGEAQDKEEKGKIKVPIILMVITK